MVIVSDEERSGRWGEISEIDKLLLKGEVFDLKCSVYGLNVTVCKKRSSCPLLVYLYTCMGLHRYNFLKGTKFVVSRVNKYVRTTQTAAKSYYITLDAKEPASSSSSSPPQTSTFQIKVSEGSHGRFSLGCYTARIRGDTSGDRETNAVYIPGKSYFLGNYLPQWPPENPFEQFCLLPQLMGTIGKNLRTLMICILWTNVVAIDGEGLYAKNATFYIRFKDLFRARLGQNDKVDRVAIIRRRYDEDTGAFSLEGQILSSQVIPRKLKIAALAANEEEEDTGCLDQVQSSDIIRFSQGPFSENKRIKLNPIGFPNQISSPPLATGETANLEAA
ncbi:UPF0725 protein At1g02770 [Eutrema salsugineum]|uniref:UPF0725 protein At1g02770 n=1 Tax=Eutrema salsugineum TaxID=72664 RepID=UPI000CECF469|nr:UPF0725 protein At1g02770 [Eutrema salsugineum]